MKKLLMILSLVFLMVSVFAGCGQSDATEDLVDDTTTVSDVTENLADDTENESDESKEVVKLKMAMFAFGDTEDVIFVQEELNKILREKINVEVDLVMISAGTYVEQTNLMLSSGETLDIMSTLVVPTLASYVSNGQFIPLDDLLDEYGQGIYDNIAPQYIQCSVIDGQIYGITTNRDLASGFGFAYRTDMAEKYGIKDIKTLEDVEEALRIIKENEPDIYPLVPQSGASLAGILPIDDLGDSNMLGVLSDMDKSYDVINYYDSDSFSDWTTMMRSWYIDDLIMPDVLNNTETGATLVRNGRGFGYLSHTKPGFDVQESKAAGVNMTVVELMEPLATTTGAQALVWAIASNSEHPEKAMQLMNLMYSDAQVSNLLIYGIENVHYVITDEENGIIGFPEGIDASTIKYPNGMGWGWPNQFISYVWEGNSPNYWEKMDEFNRTAIASDAMGFTFNSENVATEMATCSSIINQYKDALMAGVLDPDEVLEKFNNELVQAGMEKIIKEKQDQLDDWVANK